MEWMGIGADSILSRIKSAAKDAASKPHERWYAVRIIK